ncbi:MAG: nucleoside-diphosphate sugar epimerase/dehydratase, partial [Pyrinomonadaceae bacterium]
YYLLPLNRQAGIFRMTIEKKEPSGSQIWWARLLSRRLQFFLDLLVLLAAFVLANLLRFDFEIPVGWQVYALIQIPLVLLIQFSALNLTGARAFIWRYTGITHIKSFFYAALASFAIILALRFGLPNEYTHWHVPVSVNIIDTTLAFCGTLGLRVMRRTFFERYEKRKRLKGANASNGIRRPVLLIGAGQAGVLAAKEILGRGDLDLEIKGFVDDDPGKQRRTVVQELRVLGATEDLPRLVRRIGIDHVVITIAQASRQDIRRIVEICEKIPIKVRIIPGLYEILEGHVEVSLIRDVQIEDLLGRDPVQLDEESINEFLSGKIVMVTGAGGSIGSELARQVARFQPESLLLVERAEFALFNIDRELRESFPQLQLVPVVADVGDAERMRTVFGKHRPQVVLHAAAHKHVPLMEYNPGEAVKNNVLATSRLGELAGEAGAEVFVLISTDKAVCPTSVMGASKRLAELVVQDLNRRLPTRFVAVRFGNVIGSAGSVIPIFREQIRRGGPVTVTDKRMTRYFMTIPEASQLVLQAGAMGMSRQGGEVFILHMGEPVRIIDLAEAIITLSGLVPHEDIKIVETGIRPGEKLHEKLKVEEEDVAGTSHPKIFINRIADRAAEDIRKALVMLSQLSVNGHEQELRAYLSELLPESNLSAAPDTSLCPEEEPEQDATLSLEPADKELIFK